MAGRVALTGAGSYIGGPANHRTHMHDGTRAALRPTAERRESGSQRRAMYWYYKVPLIILLVLVGAGLSYLIWRSLPASVTGAVGAPLSRVAVGEPAEAPGTTPPALAPTPGAAALPAARPPAPVSSVPAPLPAAALPTAPPAVPPTAPDPARQAAALETARLLETAREQVEGYNYLAARQLAQRILTQPGVAEFDPTWMAAAELINRINTVFMTSQTPSPERRAYSIEPGDSLSRIALGLQTSVGALQRINGLDPTNPIIYPGAVLYSLQAAWSIRVVKSRFVLLLMNGTELYRLYHIGIGRSNKTPAGSFVITSKVIHPAWTPPGKSFPYGHPENPLGTHWLGLSPIGGTDPTLRGFGIHGTWQPDSIGSATSEGCVRMLNEQVGELFDFIPEPGRGTPIQVVIED